MGWILSSSSSGVEGVVVIYNISCGDTLRANLEKKVSTCMISRKSFFSLTYKLVTLRKTAGVSERWGCCCLKSQAMIVQCAHKSEIDRDVTQ